MVKPLYLHGRLRAHVAGVVAGPLAEWAFVVVLSRNRFALDDDFRARRNGQAGVFAFDHLHRMALKAAHPLVLRHAVRHFHATSEIEQRIVPERNRQLTGLAAREIFVAHNAPLLPRRNEKSQRVAIVHHHAISSQVDPALVGIPRDVHRAGADVAPAIELMPLRTGEFEHVNVFTLDHVLHDRAIVDHFGFDIFQVGNVFLDVFHEL